MIMDMIFQLKGDDPAVATDYYNGWLIELENIFADLSYFKCNLASMDRVSFSTFSTP
jgi:hypothetical protein